MKISAGGITIEIEHGDDPAQALALLRRLAPKSAPADANDPSPLTPKQREVFDVVVKHPNGAHYTIIAEEAGIPAQATNARLNGIVATYPGLLERIASGVFRANT